MSRIAVLALEGALGSSIALPMEMLRAGEQHARAHHALPAAARRAPLITVAGESREPVRMSGGLRVLPDVAVDELEPPALLIVPSLWRTPQALVQRHPRVQAALGRIAQGETLVCSVGTGSYFPAACGLLDARPATTHWSFFADFARRFPQVELRRRHLVTRAGNFYCAGSINSAADLMIHFVERLFGGAAARQVEGQFSPEIRRPFVANDLGAGDSDAHPDELVWLAQDWMRARLGEALRMPQVAAAVGLSARSFNRRFRAALGISPARFLLEARLELARDLLRQSDLAAGEIAQRCGFANASHFSSAFGAATGASPQAWRRRVRGKLFTAAPPSMA